MRLEGGIILYVVTSGLEAFIGHSMVSERLMPVRYVLVGWTQDGRSESQMNEGWNFFGFVGLCLIGEWWLGDVTWYLFDNKFLNYILFTYLYIIHMLS